MLPESRGKNYILRILSVYNDLFKSTYGFTPQITFGKFGMMMKRLSKTHSELQIAALLVVFFNWKGITGNDQFESQKLRNASHNVGWFFSCVNQYEAYARNVFGLKLDDESSTREFVARNLRALSTE